MLWQQKTQRKCESSRRLWKSRKHSGKKQSEELAEVDKKLVLAENKKQEADAVSKGDRGCSELEKSGRAVPQKAIKTRENLCKYNEKNIMMQTQNTKK